MPKGSAIRPPKHGEIRHRAPERAAMKATRRVLDPRDSTPTIRTNLPYWFAESGSNVASVSLALLAWTGVAAL